MLTVDEPTICMTFQVNNSPFAGEKDRSGGKFLTSRQLRDRLKRETLHNVALKVEEGTDADKFKVCGRGELHLSILIENMRREGYELAVSRPEVIIKQIDGQLMEPFEQLVVDIEEQHQGGVMETPGRRRKAQLKNMEPDGKGRVRLDYMIPARGLIGFQTEFRTLTAGHRPAVPRVRPLRPEGEGAIAKRQNGVLISNATGPSAGLRAGPDAGTRPPVHRPGDEIYEGQIVGIHSQGQRPHGQCPASRKQLTNFRASGKDDAIKPDPGDQVLAGTGAGIHRGRRTRRSHPEGDPPAQEVPAPRPTASAPRARPDPLDAGSTGRRVAMTDAHYQGTHSGGAHYNPDPHAHPGLHAIAIFEAIKGCWRCLPPAASNCSARLRCSAGCMS